MCGLVGIAGNTIHRDMKIFRDMLLLDQLRGMDSTGVATVAGPINSPVVVEKELDGPDNIWNMGSSKIFDYKGVSRVVNKVMMGHNRAATVGKITRDNAHPFTFEHITGMHNGSLDYWPDLDRNGKEKYDVDSKAIFATIANRGIDATWKDFIGAASLVWWDTKDETINFARNGERPMFFAKNEADNTLIWASEEWMILVAAQRHGMKLKTFEEERESNGQKYTAKFTTFPTGTNRLYKFKVTNTNVVLVEDRELEKKSSLRGTSTTGTTTYGGDEAINRNWARGLDKAGRELVGQPFKFAYKITAVQTGRQEPYFVGHFHDQALGRVHIYPKTWANASELEWENAGDKRNYVLGCRPRVLLSANGKPWAYCIDMDNIKYAPDGKKIHEVLADLKKETPPVVGEVVQLYRTFGNRMVPVDTWRQNLRAMGGCCDFCGMGISMEDHNKHLWSHCGVICSGCVADGSYKQMFEERLLK